MSTPKSKSDAIVNACPPHLRGQLADVLEHLSSCAATGIVPEGNVAAFLNRQDPHIQRIIKDIKDAADTPRDRPFVPKETPAERYQSFGLEPETSVMVSDALDGLSVGHELTQRLGGSDASRPDEAPTMRDMVAAAVDIHSNGD